MNVDQNIILDQPLNLESSPFENTILSLFKLQVEKNPEKPAVKMGELFLTYGQLNLLSDNLAASLIQKGLREDTPVGILLPRSLEYIISIFGILKAGGGYVPMNPTDGEERLLHIIKDCTCPFILTQTRFLKNRFDLFGTEVINVELEGDDLKGIDDNFFSAPKINPSGLAYIIYTSGTTGLPKGVMIEHRNLFWYVKNYVPKIQAEDRVLQAMSITFDGSVSEIFPALCNGAFLILARDNVSQMIREERINYTMLTPSLAEVIESKDCNTLKYIMIGGEKLSENVVKKFLPNVDVYNGYGPTEVTVVCSMTLIRNPNRIHIGGKLDGAELYVVKPTLELCDQPNEIGELLIGGGGVGRGYFNNPELTEKRFLENPFGPGMVYRSGDMVRWNELGDLDYIGRVDRQIKLRGFRMELDGIEGIINSFPGVTRSHLKVHNQNLIAYISPKNINLEDLIAYLGNHLPKHAIPFKFFFLDHFPLNATGKIDEKQLPLPNILDEKKEFLPETLVEQKIETLWKKVLSFDSGRLSLKDNFFDLGGASLHAIKLIKILNDEFHAEVPLQFIYRHPRLEDFIESFNQMNKEKAPRVKNRPPLNILLLDSLKCLPSTVWWYFGFSLPFLILIALFLFSPWLAIGVIALEFLVEKTWGLPRSNFLRKLKIATHFPKFKYKSITILEETPLESLPRTIFAIAPHGISEDHVFPFEKLLLSKKIKYNVTYDETLFKLPLSKTFYSLFGGTPAKKESYYRAEKENLSLVITPGDAYEVYYLDEPSTLVLKDNRHFFKYALETGTSLTPVFFYNYNKFYKYFKHFHQERVAILEKNKSSVIQPFYGRWFLPIPFKVDLKAVIGKPLMVQKIVNPTWQEVEDLFEQYCSHLNGLYQKYADKDAPPLKIL